MDARSVAVATITWARSPAEEALLASSLTALSETGLPVAVADRGTSRTLTRLLDRLPGFSVTVPSEEGLVAQVKASMQLAARTGRRFILYSEADKEAFFQSRMREFIDRAPEEAGVGVVLAARSYESFGTFPAMQRYTEGVINHLSAQFMGAPADYSYGPFLFNGALLSHIAMLDNDLGWGWRHSTFREARRRQLRVVHITGEHICPPDQRTEDDHDRTHRIRQLAQNIRGLVG